VSSNYRTTCHPGVRALQQINELHRLLDIKYPFRRVSLWHERASHSILSVEIKTILKKFRAEIELASNHEFHYHIHDSKTIISSLELSLNVLEILSAILRSLEIVDDDSNSDIIDKRIAKRRNFDKTLLLLSEFLLHVLKAHLYTILQKNQDHLNPISRKCLPRVLVVSQKLQGSQTKRSFDNVERSILQMFKNDLCLQTSAL
jgi:hypothetical protein